MVSCVGSCFTLNYINKIHFIKFIFLASCRSDICDSLTPVTISLKAP